MSLQRRVCCFHDAHTTSADKIYRAQRTQTMPWCASAVMFVDAIPRVLAVNHWFWLGRAWDLLQATFALADAFSAVLFWLCCLWLACALLRRAAWRQEIPACPAEPVVVPDLGTKLKVVLVVRDDLSMRKGKTCAQCAHAAEGLVCVAAKRQPLLTAAYLQGPTKIVLRTPNEDGMTRLQRAAANAGLVTFVVVDDGQTTQVPSGSRTVLAIGPGPSSVIDALTGKLKLLQ